MPIALINSAADLQAVIDGDILIPAVDASIQAAETLILADDASISAADTSIPAADV